MDLAVTTGAIRHVELQSKVTTNKPTPSQMPNEQCQSTEGLAVNMTSCYDNNRSK